MSKDVIGVVLILQACVTGRRHVLETMPSTTVRACIVITRRVTMPSELVRLLQVCKLRPKRQGIVHHGSSLCQPKKQKISSPTALGAAYGLLFWLWALRRPTNDLMRGIPGNMGWPVVGDTFAFIAAFSNPAGIPSFLRESRGRVLVLDEASQFMLKVIANMLVSLEPERPEQEEFRANFKAISSSFTSLPLKLHGTAFHRGLGGRNRMYAMLDAVIACRRAGEVCEDFLQTLLMKYTRGQQAGAASDPAEEEKLADAQLKDNILTLLVVGHDTTMAARPGSSSSSTRTPSMPYTTKVMNETLRRATILPWYSRKASQDFSIDGFQVAKGASVNLDVVSIHHDAAVFADPERFDPDRFDGSLKPYSFLGFGSGPRMCPGMSLAKLEICVFAHHLVCTYDWKALEDDASVQPTLVRMPNNMYPILATALP
ncbi:abscisic acid 8'-hydroxylase 3-like [Aegilops tauschii subsp. strangulata]|uniref:abscisic acid 8'-hydroxylase 3-like n=1 Tax=Aegilops tauschii subsp. strangulata TaxID=200361 RepID=UPI003CC8A7B6